MRLKSALCHWYHHTPQLISLLGRGISESNALLCCVSVSKTSLTLFPDFFSLVSFFPLQHNPPLPTIHPPPLPVELCP